MNDPLGLFGDEQSNDPLGLFEDTKKEGTLGTAFKRALSSASTTADTAISLPAGALATYLGFEEQGDEIFRKLDERTAARTAFGNPDEELSLGQEAVGMIGTLPAQLLGMAGSPAMRGKAMIDAGETLPRAMLATQGETAVNAAGLAPLLPAASFAGRAAIGAGANVALGAGSDALTSALAETDAIKEQFDPLNPRARMLEAITGGALQGALGERPAVQPSRARNIEVDVRTPDGQTSVGRTFDPTNETAQLELFDQPLQGRMVSPFEATPGDWRIDENGMPVRADLTLDAQAAQTPLQRDLFGEALDPSFPRDPNQPLGPRSTGDIPGVERFSEPVNFRNDPENQTSLQFAMDTMEPAALRAAVEQTQLGRDMPAEGRLEAAKMEAETMAWLEKAKRPETKKPRPVAKGRGKGQRGVIKIDWSDISKVDNKPLDGRTIPPTPNVAAAIEAAKKLGKDGKQWNYLQSGSTSVAMKTGSPIIRAVESLVQNAVKRADLAVRNYIIPTEDSLRTLPKQELLDLGDLLKREMLADRRANPNDLVANLSEKQLRAYTKIREMLDETLKVQNEARVAKGQPPINAREAYMASRWQGDFRQPVYDAEGNLIWYLAAQTKISLKRQIEALKKIRPDVVIDESKSQIVKSSGKGTDLQSAYSTMLDILDPKRDKEAINAIKAAIEDQLSVESELTLAQSKHFKQKTGVRGFAGDRPFLDRVKDTTDMLQQQIQYAKNAFKWSEMQKISDDVASIVSDEELQKTQPNNIKYIREYTKNALGFGEAQAVRALEDSMREGLGISPQALNEAVGNVKSFFILQKLAISAGYTLSNLIQAGNVIPYLADLTNRGIVGNPVTTMPVGMLGGMAMGISHYLKSLGSGYLDMLPNQFFKDAFLYAEENGVTARSVYDEAPIENTFSTVKRSADMLGKTMTVPETFVRSVAFMTYAEWLRSSGKFTDQNALFAEAERLVNMSMVDYRETERPMIFSKLGATGNFLNTLQTYPMSFYNQWAYMLGQAAKGKPAGLMAIAAFQFAVAGAMGLPFFDDMEKLYKWMRDNMTGDSTWAKAMSSPFFSDPKMWLIDNLGEASVYGYLSDKTGLGLTSRVAAPGAGAMLQSPVGPITDIAGQIGAVGKAALDPTNTTKVAQAAMKVAPVGLQGFLETQPFMEGTTFVTRPDGTRVYQKSSDLADRSGVYARTPEEERIRALGMRNQSEVLARDVGYATRSANQAMTKRGGEIVDKYYDAVRRGDVKKAAELNKLYVSLTGKAISQEQFTNQLNDEFFTEMDKNIQRSRSPAQILNTVRAKKILEENK